MDQANWKIFISSSSRTPASASSSNFSIKFPTNNYLQDRKNMRLAYLGMYNTFYNVDATNNQMNFRVGVTTYTITISPGQYDAVALAGLIQAAMTSQTANSWVVSYNSNTKKYTITGTSAFVLLFSTGVNASTSLWRVMGFASSNGLGGIDTPSGTSTTSTQVAQLTYPLVCYVKLNNISSDQTFSSDPGDGFTFVIPINVQPGELIEYQANENFDQYVKLPDTFKFMTYLSVSLAGQNLASLSLNGSEWIMVLEFYP